MNIWIYCINLDLQESHPPNSFEKLLGQIPVVQVISMFVPRMHCKFGVFVADSRELAICLVADSPFCGHFSSFRILYECFQK